MQSVDNDTFGNAYRQTIDNLRKMLDYNNTKLAGWEKATMQMNGDTMDSNRKP